MKETFFEIKIVLNL